MDNIKQIIQSFNTKEIIEFKNFLKRQKLLEERKDIKLVDLLYAENNYNPKQLVQLLETKNLNSYHTLRKRLFTGLSEFILIKLKKEDENDIQKITSAYHLADYMFQINITDLAWKFLLLAEKLALEKNEFSLLNTIYLLQIKQVEHQDRTTLVQLIQRYKSNKQYLQIEENLILAKSIVLDELNKVKKGGGIIDFNEIIEETLRAYDINVSEINHQKFIFNIIEIIRVNIVAQKHYYDFEPFIIHQYHTYFSNNSGQSNSVYKASMLYLIAQTLYRNKKFKLSLSYLDELDKLDFEMPAKTLSKIKIKRIQLKAANEVLLGNVQTAIKLLEQKINQKIISNSDYYNNIINLGVYYFLQNDYKKSQKLLFKFNHSDNWYRKTMGIEWLLKRQLMEVILFYELGEIELCESRLRSIERNFNFFGDNEYYKRVFHFISLLKDFVLNIGKSKDDRFIQKVEDNIQWIPFEQEDVQHVAFYAWLKAKMLGKDYYKTLLELLSEDKNQLK